MLRALGAEVYVCPANVKADDPRSYHQVAKKLVIETKNSVYINQYLRYFLRDYFPPNNLTLYQYYHLLILW